MNIMRFLTPKSSVSYLDASATVRNGYEKMSYHKFRAIPVVTSEGIYVGTVTEGDFLHGMISNNGCDLRQQEKICIRDILRPDWNPAVNITCTVEQLFHRVAEQNFVPVVDDRGVFIGIVTRKAVLTYLIDNYQKQHENKTEG